MQWVLLSCNDSIPFFLGADSIAAFTNEPIDFLNMDSVIEYMMAIQHPGRWCGSLFQVVLHLYEQIKAYMWLRVIGLLPTQTLCLMQSVVDDVIVLEYMRQKDHIEYINSKDSLAYRCLFEARNPMCSTQTMRATDCEFKAAADRKYTNST
jgi:hypothetical protein